jgi:hypothetical protein
MGSYGRRAKHMMYRASATYNSSSRVASSHRRISPPHSSRSETKRKKDTRNWTGTEVCATPEKNENKKSEKDTDVVQTVYDRPKRRARVTAKGSRADPIRRW